MRRRSIAVAAVTLLATLPAAAPAQGPDYVPGQVIVRFEGQPSERPIELPPGLDVRRAAAELRGNPRVAYAVPNYVATASAGLPNDPGTRPGTPGRPGNWVRKQWNFLPCGSLCGAGASARHQSLGGINALAAWGHLRSAGRPGGAGVTIAVLDTGIASRSVGRFHRSPDFGRSQFVSGRDIVDRDSLAVDENGHGTHIAGTIGERTDNGVAVTGLAYRAHLMAVRVLNELGRGQADDIARGIRYAADHGADVINMSFNFSCRASVPGVLSAVRFAHRRGVVLVASVGNAPTEACTSPPATLPHVIGVGGTTAGACLGSYSLKGRAVDLVAPGGGAAVGPCSSSANRAIFQLTFRPTAPARFVLPASYVGTSMAAAHVSGVAALVIASRVAGRDPAPGDVEARLLETARDLGVPGPDASFGAGLLDAGRATNPG